MALNFEALLQAISICLWLTLVVFAWAKKQYIGIVVSILVMTISAFIAFNLLYDLDLNNFQKGSSHLFWYPCNYMLVVIFYKLILKIEKTEDERG